MQRLVRVLDKRLRTILASLQLTAKAAGTYSGGFSTVSMTDRLHPSLKYQCSLFAGIKQQLSSERKGNVCQMSA